MTTDATIQSSPSNEITPSILLLCLPFCDMHTYREADPCFPPLPFHVFSRHSLHWNFPVPVTFSLCVLYQQLKLVNTSMFQKISVTGQFVTLWLATPTPPFTLTLLLSPKALYS